MSPLVMHVARKEFKAAHKQQLELLRNKAKKQWQHRAQKEAWKDFFLFNELFADMAPCYWTIVHKAQGSTFERAYVCLTDIYRNTNVDERYRMIYTAVTRASKQVLLTL